MVSQPCPEDMKAEIGDYEVLRISSEYMPDPYDGICSKSVVSLIVGNRS